MEDPEDEFEFGPTRVKKLTLAQLMYEQPLAIKDEEDLLHQPVDVDRPLTRAKPRQKPTRVGVW